MRHINTDDDEWFEKRPAIWVDWVAAHMRVTAAIERGPEKTT
jgi:hypothetical protein